MTTIYNYPNEHTCGRKYTKVSNIGRRLINSRLVDYTPKYTDRIPPDLILVCDRCGVYYQNKEK